MAKTPNQSTKLDQERPLQESVTLLDSRVSGTAGGTFTSGSFQVRKLDAAIIGSASWIALGTPTVDATFSSGNYVTQFILQPGTYEFDISAIGYAVASHKCRLYNVTDATDYNYMYGTNIYAHSTYGNGIPSTITKRRLTITVATTFELQHKCLATFATSGFGQSAAFGVPEIYAEVGITKVA